MNTSEMFEATMLIGFSVSWYWSISKMLLEKTAKGKSLGFVLIICAGYCAGIASKISLYAESGHLSYLIWLYAWNLIVTSYDALLVARFSGVFRR